VTPSQVLAILIVLVACGVVLWLLLTHDREARLSIDKSGRVNGETENPYEDPRWIRQMDEIRLMKSPCGNCGAQSWINAIRLLDVPTLDIGSSQRGSMPAAITSCESCGEVHFFSAKQLGLVDGYRLNVRPKGRP